LRSKVKIKLETLVPSSDRENDGGVVLPNTERNIDEHMVFNEEIDSNRSKVQGKNEDRALVSS